MRTARASLTATLALLLVSPSPALRGQQRVERDVVYRWHFGTALLLDIYRPREPNGAAIIWINGSGFHAAPSYLDWELKRAERMALAAQPYLDAGFTIFSINHRAAPEYRYPAALEDAQRAVRFARAQARRLALDPRMVAARGTSSGGHLASLLGTLGTEGHPGAVDPLDRLNAGVGAVVAIRASFDLRDSPSWPSETARGVTSFIGTTVEQAPDLYAQASPITHVSQGDASFLIVHGEVDDVIPVAQADRMVETLQAVGAEVEFVRLSGAGHGWRPTTYDESHSALWLVHQFFGPEKAREVRPLLDAHHNLVTEWFEVEVADVVRAMDVLARARAADEHLTVPGWYWDRVCWRGAVRQMAAVVINACNEAVRSAPRDPEFRDSRGLARALSGDLEGAIEDFDFFLQEVTDEERFNQRSEWTAQLRAGQNPFDEELLRSLRGG